MVLKMNQNKKAFPESLYRNGAAFPQQIASPWALFAFWWNLRPAVTVNSSLV